MKLNNLKPAEGSVQTRKRIARGQGSGLGATAGRGHKGAKSRAGYKQKRNHEGGQMPLQMRLPKRGFNNYAHRVEYVGINLSRLQYIADKLHVTDITVATLVENGVVGKNDLVKVLANGELKSQINVSAHAFSATAKAAIEQKGGTASITQ